MPSGRNAEFTKTLDCERGTPRIYINKCCNEKNLGQYQTLRTDPIVEKYIASLYLPVAHPYNTVVASECAFEYGAERGAA